MKLKILQLGAEQLTKRSADVTDFKDEALQKLIDDMLHTCELDRDSTAGLAAPQIGENIRVCVVGRVTREPETRERKVDWKVMVNPEVVASSEKKTTLWEACLSIGKGEKQLWGPVTRPERVKVQYQDREGEQQTITGKGFFSHVLQHEIDHLNGELFISKVPNPDKNLWKSIDLDQYLDDNDQFPPVV